MKQMTRRFRWTGKLPSAWRLVAVCAVSSHAPGCRERESSPFYERTRTRR